MLRYILYPRREVELKTVVRVTTETSSMDSGNQNDCRKYGNLHRIVFEDRRKRVYKRG